MTQRGNPKSEGRRSKEVRNPKADLPAEASAQAGIRKLRWQDFRTLALRSIPGPQASQGWTEGTTLGSGDGGALPREHPGLARRQPWALLHNAVGVERGGFILA
jgi:hypothetical protein